MPVAVFRTIKPHKYDSNAFTVAINEEARRSAKELEKLFKKTTSTWDNPPWTSPKFTPYYPNMRPQRIEIEVIYLRYPWDWIDKGTRKNYPIRPKKKGGVLAFQTGGSPKSRVGKIASYKGRRGNVTRYSKGVIHPGIKPRKWTPAIQKEFQPIFRRNMKNAYARGARATKHLASFKPYTTG